MIPDSDFMQYIDSLGIPYREAGSELKFKYCPFCESDGKTTKPYSCFHFNRDKQTYYCHHRNSCGRQGGLYAFKLERGDLSPITKSKPVSYKRPKPDIAIKTDDEKFYDWYQKERGISKSVLAKFGVGKRRGKNKDGVEKDFMVYQYMNKNGVLVNRKYKSTDKKDVYTEKNAEKTYYGLQCLDFEDTTLYVTEGEDDTHAFYQITGLDNVVSLPYGAGTYTVEMDDINNSFDTIVLVFDCDEPGQEGAKKFAYKAGITKCYNVLLPYKDPRECLQNGVTKQKIMECVGKAKQFEHQDISSVASLKQSFMASITDVKARGVMTPYPAFNHLMMGFRPNELTILTGQTGSGKTTFAYNIGLWCEMAGLPVLAMSFENRISSIVKKLIMIDSGEVMFDYDLKTNGILQKMSLSEIEINFEKISRKELYFLNKGKEDFGYYDLKKMVEIIKYAVKFFNVGLIIIDHLHYFLKLSGHKNPVHVIDESVREIKQLTEQISTHILLLVHPAKTQDDRAGGQSELGLGSPKGASSIAQECDNFLTICRGEDEGLGYSSKVKVLKNREWGIPKKSEVIFDLKENKNTFYI